MARNCPIDIGLISAAPKNIGKHSRFTTLPGIPVRFTIVCVYEFDASTATKKTSEGCETQIAQTARDHYRYHRYLVVGFSKLRALLQNYFMF